MIWNICWIVDFKNLVSLVSVKNTLRTKRWFSELAEGELKDFVKASFQTYDTSFMIEGSSTESTRPSIYDLHVDV